MKTKCNLKEPYFQENTHLLDDDFDLFSPEVFEYLLFQKEPKNTGEYMMEFKTQIR